MDVRELKEKLQEMNIPETYYEINGHLMILMDERTRLR